MRTRYIPAGVMLLAGAVTCIISIVQKQEVVAALKTLLIVLILFYIIGFIAKFFIEKILKDFTGKETQNAEENLDGEDSDTDGNNNLDDVENSLDRDGINRL